MGLSYKVTGSLKAALAKVASLPASEQDEIARQIMARVSGETWDGPWSPEPSRLSAIGHFLDSILPKHPLARTISLVMGSFVLFVQAPMVLLAGVMMLVSAGFHEASVPPSTAPSIQQVSVGGSNRAVVQPIDPPTTAPSAETADGQD